MNSFVFVSVLVLITAVIILIADRIIVLNALDDISVQLENILNSDTNARLFVSCRSRKVRRFAAKLNGRIEDMRRKDLDLRNRNNEISSAITNAAHDMRTPITAISGYLELLEHEELDENSKRYVGIVGERTKTLRKLTEELFDYSLVSSEESKVILSQVSLKGEIETAVAAYYAALKDRNIEPVIDLPSSPVIKELDRELLQRIIGNIISNAVRYSDGDLRIELDESGKMSFSNSASGLSETEVGRLFERFYTVSDARTGHGLGLSIAKLLTEKMGGKISASYADCRLIITIQF